MIWYRSLYITNNSIGKRASLFSLLFNTLHSHSLHAMAAAALLRHICKPQTYASLRIISKTSSYASLSTSTDTKRLSHLFQVRSVCAPAEAVAGFDEMVAQTQRKYYMLGGKGGVGKTSCAASLAVKFANHGHPTIVVSTDPAHSLSDSFDQDLAGGMLVPVQGLDSPLYALEINPGKAMEEFQATRKKEGDGSMRNFMDSMGLGMLGDQLGELKLEELFDTLPPGLDEAIAISKALATQFVLFNDKSALQVMQFLESQEYSMFTRIVLDTAPTGHTLRLLSLPDFMDASIGKMMKLKQKIASATSAIKSVFGKEESQPRLDASDKLKQLKERMAKVRELFRDSETTEFVIVTIPTVMAVRESSRLCASLKKENVPVQRLIVNQVLPPSASNCNFCEMKRKDQMRSLDMIRSDPELTGLSLIQAPLVDAEIRGVPALKFMADKEWDHHFLNEKLRLRARSPRPCSVARVPNTRLEERECNPQPQGEMDNQEKPFEMKISFLLQRHWSFYTYQSSLSHWPVYELRVLC
ncbi:hypothetical protein RHMOL_Rhmol13G0122700 [Rhododendron molle]|uniref:Uncharacterized protein n=1 Tax=Rhododendron molle TaxID=49168 RepID=A0ACC0L6H7_RHOML|nr:hypothetical protein RHMOL_Rhmol13G0122700 [Rhododendron molle]